jgi:large subunit ribosomal protein L31
MKKEIHPENYRYVVFRDTSNGEEFLTRSCAPTKETTNYDGEEYPLYSLGISSSSHPFYTGQQTFVDTAGRVDKFQRRAAKAKELQEERAAKTKKK